MIKKAEKEKERVDIEKANEYIDELLKAENMEKDNNGRRFLSIPNMDEERAKAICILGNNQCLQKVSFNMVIAAGTGEHVNTANEIVSGLLNLKVLERYGMNTPKNIVEVILAGGNATEKSLELWEKRKTELQKAARNSEHSSLYHNPDARAAVRKMVNEKLNKLDEKLNHPAKNSGKTQSKRSGMVR